VLECPTVPAPHADDDMFATMNPSIIGVKTEVGASFDIDEEIKIAQTPCIHGHISLIHDYTRL